MSNLPQTYDLLVTLTLIASALSLASVVTSLLAMRKAEKSDAKADNALLGNEVRREQREADLASRLEHSAVLEKNIDILSAEVSDLRGAVLNASATLEDLSKKDKAVKKSGKRK